MAKFSGGAGGLADGDAPWSPANSFTPAKASTPASTMARTTTITGRRPRGMRRNRLAEGTLRLPLTASRFAARGQNVRPGWARLKGRGKVNLVNATNILRIVMLCGVTRE